MKTIIRFAVVIFSVAMLWSCGTDNDDQQTSGEAATFELFLENGTDEEIEIFFQGSETDAEFESRGIIDAGAHHIISNVSVRQTYVVRASFVGDGVEGYFYEQTINQTSPTDLILVINE